MSRGYPVEQWRDWIEQQQTSGLSVAAFCRSIGVSENAFYLRRKKLSGQAGSGTSGQGLPAFVALKVAEGSSLGVRVELPCGAVVSSSDQETIRTVVAALLDHGASL